MWRRAREKRAVVEGVAVGGRREQLWKGRLSGYDMANDLDDGMRVNKLL